MFSKCFLHVFRVTKSTILWIQPCQRLHGSHRWWTTISWQPSVNLYLILYIRSEFRPSRVLDQALCLRLYLWKPSREVRLCPLTFPLFAGDVNSRASPSVSPFTEVLSFLPCYSFFLCDIILNLLLPSGSCCFSNIFIFRTCLEFSRNPLLKHSYTILFHYLLIFFLCIYILFVSYSPSLHPFLPHGSPSNSHLSCL